MLLSSQVQAVAAWIVAAIADCPALVPIALDRVVWQDQDFPERPYPYALLSYTGSVEEGISPAQWVDDLDNLNTRTGDDTNLSITIVSKQSDTAPTLDMLASSYVRELKARLRSFVARGLAAADLAVRDVNVVPDVSRLQGRSQFESRAVLDILFGHAVVVLEQPGVIETAFVTGTTSPATPSRTFEITG